MIWSFSRLNAWRGCKIAWHNNYILKIREGLRQNFFSQYGSYCEDIIQKCEEGEIDYEFASDYFAENFDDNVDGETVLMSRGSMPPLDLKHHYYLAAYDFFFHFRGFSTPTISFQEKVELTLPCGDDFIGYIDRLSGTPDNYSIVDFKSKGKFKSKKELEEYARQLYLYSEYTIEKYGDKPSSMYFHLFRSYGKTNRDGTRADYVEVPWNKKDFQKAKDWRDRTIEEIKEVGLKEGWTPENKNPDFFFCQHLCSYVHKCEVHKKVHKEQTNEYYKLFDYLQ